MTIRPISSEDLDWEVALLTERWSGPLIVSRGRLHDASQLPGFIALDDNQPVGLVTYLIENRQCEIVSLDSIRRGRGTGSALVQSVLAAATVADCLRVWLVTTNDNTGALQFYRKCGFRLVAVHEGAIAESRRLKPGIPEIGFNGIPLRDEIEWEIDLRESNRTSQ